MVTMDKADLSKLIQEQAISLFRRNGYDQVTVKDICRTAGTAKPTFYKLATSKADLLRSHYRTGLEELSGSAFIPDEDGSWAHAIRRYLIRVLNVLTAENYDLTAALMMSNLQDQSGLPLIAETVRERVKELTEQGQKCGEIPADCSASVLSDTLVSLTEGFISYWALHEGEPRAQQELDHCLRSVLFPVQPSSEEESAAERTLN